MRQPPEIYPLLRQVDVDGRGAGGRSRGEARARLHGRASKPTHRLPPPGQQPLGMVDPTPRKSTIHSRVVYGAQPMTPGVEGASTQDRTLGGKYGGGGGKEEEDLCL